MKLTNQYLTVSKSQEFINKVNNAVCRPAKTIPRPVQIFGAFESGIRKGLKAGVSQREIIERLRSFGIGANLAPSTATIYMSQFVKHLDRKSV